MSESFTLKFHNQETEPEVMAGSFFNAKNGSEFFRSFPGPFATRDPGQTQLFSDSHCVFKNSPARRKTAGDYFSENVDLSEKITGERRGMPYPFRRFQRVVKLPRNCASWSLSRRGYPESAVKVRICVCAVYTFFQRYKSELNKKLFKHRVHVAARDKPSATGTIFSPLSSLLHIHGCNKMK